jgi:phage terminase Nu1 subunit (DNA packaging protein)
MSGHPVGVIAKLLDMTPRRVQQLVKEGIIPKPKSRGEYEIGPCVIGYIRHLNSMLNGEAGDLLTEKTRLVRAQAEKAEFEIAQLKDSFVSLAKAERGWSALVVAFRAKMLTLPYRAAAFVINKSEAETERIITDMVYEALAELSNWKPDDDEDDECVSSGVEQGGEAGGPAAENDDKQVG